MANFMYEDELEENKDYDLPANFGGLTFGNPDEYFEQVNITMGDITIPSGGLTISMPEYECYICGKMNKDNITSSFDNEDGHYETQKLCGRCFINVQRFMIDFFKANT